MQRYLPWNTSVLLRGTIMEGEEAVEMDGVILCLVILELFQLSFRIQSLVHPGY